MTDCKMLKRCKCKYKENRKLLSKQMTLMVGNLPFLALLQSCIVVALESILTFNRKNYQVHVLSLHGSGGLKASRKLVKSLLVSHLSLGIIWTANCKKLAE